MSSGRSMGRVDNGVVAPYQFVIGDLIREGWEKTKGFKATFWGGFLIYVGISLLLLAVATGLQYLAQLALGQGTPMVDVIKNVLNLVRNFIQYPMVVGLLMMGIKRSVDLPVQPKMVISYYNRIWRIVGVALTMMVLIFVPVFLGTLFIMMSANFSMFVSALMMLIGGVFCAAAVYLIISYLFAVVLTVEKNLGIWQSLEVSRKGISQHWFKVFFTSVAMFGIFVLACIPLFIGLIWALPLGYCMWGALYRTIFGVTGIK